MKHYTTIYKLYKDDVVKIFDSEKEACEFLGVKKCSVASCFRNKYKCKGWKIERVGISTHGETKTRLHKIWESMHERCYNKNHKYFGNYGGRGIYVCGEWSDYIHFRDWALNNGYAEDLTIDRKDVNGNYTPSNCRWITMKEQQNNKRTNRCISMNGETHTMSEWSEIIGIKKTTLKERLNSGWSVEKSLTTPVRKRAKMDLEG